MRFPILRHSTRAVLAAAAGCVAACVAGCVQPIAPDCSSDALILFNDDRFDPFQAVPRLRVGCLPFPGPFTLFTAANPTDLGEHSYHGAHTTGGPPEVERGIVYTCRGGFIDICHVRLSADLVAYVQPRIAYALERDWTCVRVRPREPSVFRVTLDYPDAWWMLTATERRALVPELSLRIAQQLAFTMTAWHEIITWYGYKSAVIVSEASSAFTYEDIPSHALGVMLAGEALRSGDGYDDAMTAALDRSLHSLGVVDAEKLERAMSAVEGDWWADGAPLKRSLDLGFGDGVIEPWIVPDLCPAGTDPPTAFAIPTLRDVGGIDFSSHVDVLIEPNIFETRRILQLLPDAKDGLVRAGRDFPLLIADIRAKIGADQTRP